MRTVKLVGGLGNQMFQYAFYLAIKKQKKGLIFIDLSYYNTTDCHNGFELTNIFNIPKWPFSPFYFYIYKIIRKLNGGAKLKVDPAAGHFKVENTIYMRHAVYNGFWQSEKYFKDIEDIVRKTFQFKNPLSDNNVKYKQLIKKYNSVSIHIRRGDYLMSPDTQGICTSLYYTNAIEYLKSRVHDMVFFVFSDDIEWCKFNMNFGDSSVYFIDENKGKFSYVDMQLMSYCKHNILANSSFSWWGAWLNNNKNKIVIAPAKWFYNEDVRDILPDTWIKLMG